ncbi:MAG: hypothetical protein E7649_04645 [Ruminococcaceae bacterium]|nr:hypothetical protein [Oscillospiraceae bacterium]
MKKLIALLILLALVFSCSCDFLPGLDPDDDENGTYDNATKEASSDLSNSETETEGKDSACERHTDSDDNGKCDNCSVSVIITIDLYAINDLHGKISDTDADEGVDELTSYLKAAAQTDEHSIILSSGDMWQGGSESNLTKGLIITDWMNSIGTVSMTLGNHEFDWGEQLITENAALAEFPFLAINVFDRDTDERAEYCDASVVVECGEIQIGIIGAIGDCYSSIAPDKVQDVYFKTGDELCELVKAESERLRQEGVDYIVYSLHDGYERSTSTTTSVTDSQLSSYYDTELSRDGYVDLVFEGHTHKSYVMKDAYGTYHLQNGGDNQGISHVEVAINTVNLNSYISIAEFVRSSVYDSLDDDPIVNELLQKYEDAVAIGRQKLGYNAQYRGSDFLRSLVARLYYQKGIELWGEDYDVVLGGGFISIRSPWELECGDVTYSMLQSLFPFDNQLVLCSIKGSDLKNRFINSDNSNYYCYFDASLESSIENDKSYYIIVDSYSSSYAPNRLTEVERYDAEVFARDLLAEFIKQGGLGE